jgi:protein-L-isoaspartate(D-aspartate) O-methyltransferase
MVAVERHRYVPRVPLDHAHDEIAVVTHRFPDGSSLSCASEPNVVAAMLDALDVRPGSRIMEIGAGTGYNAALLATLAEPDGRVTTIDINPEVTAGARRNLDATGFHHVVVLTRDGAQGAIERTVRPDHRHRRCVGPAPGMVGPARPPRSARRPAPLAGHQSPGRSIRENR